MDVIVIGAGPAGLYAAELLAEQGRRVLVLEAGARVGGRAHNEPFHDAVHIDRGFTMIGEAVALNQGWTNSALGTVSYLNL